MKTIANCYTHERDDMLAQMIGKLVDGHLLFNADGKLQTWSASIVEFYPDLASDLDRGTEHAELLCRFIELQESQNLTEQAPTVLGSTNTQVNDTLASHGETGFVHQWHDGRWMQVRSVTLAGGETVMFWVDITQVRQEHLALLEGEDKFKRFARLASNWFWELDENLNYLYHSTHHPLLSDGDPAELVGRSRIDNLSGGLVHDEQLEAHNNALLTHDDVNVILTWDHGQGRKSYSQVLAQPSFDSKGQFLGYLGCGKDVTLACRLRDDLAHQALHDYLTGLANRRAFEDYVERVLADRHRGIRSIGFTGYCVVTIDLDQFKLINDAAGHIAGDQLLKQVARILDAELSDHGIVARLGGDEFGACLKLCPEAATERLSTVIEKITHHRFLWDSRNFSMGASAGIALVTDKSVDSSSLLSKADSACYTAKRLGRNRVEQYSPDNHFQALHAEEMQLVKLLKSAIDNDRLRLFLQPIVSTGHSGETEKHECLLRVLDEHYEHAPIGKLIPIAEKHDLMQLVDVWVVTKAIDYLKRFVQNGTKVNLSVNLSGKTLSSPGALDQIRKTVRNELDVPEGLCFEITETAAIQSLDAVIVFIEDMRAMGCTFALDDFGSGLSSYSYLKSLKVDYLKIDGSFVKEIVEDASSRAIVKSINTLSHEMGMRTVAEYVENDEIASILAELDVDFLQGFGLGKPIDAEEVILACAATVRKTGT